MGTVRIEKAHIKDALTLTALKKKVFDTEKEKWLRGQTGITDYNIQPPGYDSIEMNKYMIRELNYFKVLYEGVLIGGLILTVVGKRHGRVDRIFVDPLHQGKGIGSKVMRLMECEYPEVMTWELETSSRQLNNHYFYEKMGYKKIFEADDEFCYEKKLKKGTIVDGESRGITINGDTLTDGDLSELQVEYSNLKDIDFYGINGSNSTFSNSNLSGVSFNNCNLSEARFQNINLQKALIADLNLSQSEMGHLTLGGLHVHDTNLGEKNEPVMFERCDFHGSKFENCQLNHAEISSSDVTGMKINGISVEDLLKAYNSVQDKRKE
ncbi:GNAT family N-acetyltransferase [Rossellomorea vietnamensis]|uniref:Acetyltransferase n=1 Tax=Rossellomorea vietnamensis TaxID=218284 RepID=A0A0P6W0N8_9BACI|nr:GNAT family N-acetyltransferase [Rossellomorea vietnamensis]KPL58884.1 acetyltransferase [Rossellomorea vietnamensis]